MRFYKIVKGILKIPFYLLYRPTIIGLENIPKNTPFVLAGNHTCFLDPIMLITVVPHPVHFLAKIELFKGILGYFVKKMGAIPVNRKIHDKNALNTAIESLNKKQAVAVFPEGTINREKKTILPFKIGAVKMSKVSKCQLIPFVIKGKYKLFRKSIIIEFLPGNYVNNDLDQENINLMKKISKNLEEYNECN